MTQKNKHVHRHSCNACHGGRELKGKREGKKHVLDDKREEIVKEQLDVQSMCAINYMHRIGRATSIMRL